MFSDGIINVTKIYSVDRITAPESSDGKTVNYPSDLPCYELVFFFSGGSDTVFCGVELKDEPGSVRFMPKRAGFGGYTVSGIKPGYCIDVYFDADGDIPRTAFGLLNMDELKDKFEKIYTVWQNKRAGWYENSMIILYEIIRELKSHKKRYLPSEKRQRLDKVQAYLAENFRDVNLNYKHLAECAGLGYSYFSELFVAAYGTSPVRLVTKMRIDYAKELLITARYTVSEIAELSGFDSVYYFSKVFKELVGLPPTKYIKSLQKDN